jgi:ATP-dependent helicase/nuclease subunit A
MNDHLTDQQRRAVVARDVSVVLSSGAGCGKTTVLTERYLSHLSVDRAEVGQVVAITFTDRAAREMRGRIRQALGQLLKSEKSDARGENWARHLRNLETAPISTIHSFCAGLLRQYSVEAGLDPGFDVLEEVLSVNLESEALDAGLQKMLTAQVQPGPDLRELVLLYGWRPVIEGVRHLLRARDRGRWQRWLDLSPAQVAAAWGDFGRTRVLPRYVEYLLGARVPVARTLALLRRHPPLPGPMAERVAMLLDGLPRLAEAADPAGRARELAEAARIAGGGKKAWPDVVVYEQIKGALADLRKELRHQQLSWAGPAGDGLDSAVEVGQRFLRVACEVAREYAARKRQHGVVDFQDLLLLTRDLLRDRSEVRARLQDRYRFLLIDELQDTDPVQLELVEHLSGGGLTAGKLFAVGDANQSIYRFRGADVAQFQELRRRVPEDGRLGLTLNFRSQPAILDFANALLGHRLADYEPLRAHHPQVNPGPCVEFLWSPRGDKATVVEARTAEAEWIARRIAAMVRGEEVVRARNGGGEARDLFSPALQAPTRGDIVLLFRTLSHVHLYEAALRKWGLNYYLVGGWAFFAQQEIYDVLNLLCALENPQDAVSLAGTLRSPFCCLSDEALFVLARHADDLWSGLLDDTLTPQLPADQRERVGRARRFLLRWRSLKDRLPIARLLGEVFADSGYDAATQFEPLADRKLANLWKLVDLARTFDRSGLFGLAEFIERLGDFVGTQAREEQAATQPESADVVRLMTIHQAKGLEFPVVIIPDFGAETRRSGGHVVEWDDALGCVARPPADEEEPPFPEDAARLWEARDDIEDWHEELRTLYVACTRARDYLILSAATPETFRPTNAWTLVLSERFDPATGYCLVSDIPEEKRPQVRVFDRRNPLPEPPVTTEPPGAEPKGWHGAFRELPDTPTASEQETESLPHGAEDGSDRNDWSDLELSPRPVP